MPLLLWVLQNVDFWLSFLPLRSPHCWGQWVLLVFIRNPQVPIPSPTSRLLSSQILCIQSWGGALLCSASSASEPLPCFTGYILPKFFGRSETSWQHYVLT